MTNKENIPLLVELAGLEQPERIQRLKEKVLGESRVVSLEQARLITESYRKHKDSPRFLQRAEAFAHTLRHISIRIDPDELIVGNRTPTRRAGVVFPEASVKWIDREIEFLSTRPQDPFDVTHEHVMEFRESILPCWEGKTLEDRVYSEFDSEIIDADPVVKINQCDHAQGHIIPNVRRWLQLGPSGLIDAAKKKYREHADNEDFYKAVIISLEGACEFMKRYADVAKNGTADICRKLAESPPDSFREAVQSTWFLFVLLHMESNASSFSPGRLDQILLPYLEKDLANERLTLAEALEISECLWLRFNEIVYMRNAASAKYFAGFPIGFNVCIGGQTADGKDATNLLSCLFLKAQEHLGLPQPNLSARLYEESPQDFMEEVVRVIGMGSGMPQVFNDESVIPALERLGISHHDAVDYAVVGCVELSAQGNALGWSDAAMFNMVKVLELALNDGQCLLTGKQLGPRTGSLVDMECFEDLEKAYETQMDHFVRIMMRACEIVDRAHAEMLPSPFLSSVVDDCIDCGIDVTAGGAKYNLSGYQGIQCANVADSLAAVKQCVFDEGSIPADALLEALRTDFRDCEGLRLRLVNDVPKYGNDVEWVDRLAGQWAQKFAEKVSAFSNIRGGPCHAGFYTVSAHVPMGKNVGATPDGRRARSPLADGGLSPMAGRDTRGPTAALKSVSRVNALWASNGTLLNMKFLPSFFQKESDLTKFVAMLKGMVRLGIHHAQFNVLNADDLKKAKEDPESYRNLTVRVAGYTAYFTELAGDLQDEIIARTTFGG